MPLPKPKDDENQDDYISRCMSAQEDEDKSQDQKLAICYSKWEESAHSHSPLNEKIMRLEVDRPVQISKDVTLEPGTEIELIQERSINMNVFEIIRKITNAPFLDLKDPNTFENWGEEFVYDLAHSLSKVTDDENARSFVYGIYQGMQSIQLDRNFSIYDGLD